MKKHSGITLIALVITIIVLLILAGVTVVTLTGDNGLITKAYDAENQTEIAKEKEQISLAYTTMKLENEEDIEKREKIFQSQLDKYTGENKTKAYASSTSYIIHFIDSNRVYTIDEKGNVFEENAAIIKEDAVAGAFDGTGSEEDPYVIMSIEDLVYLANQVNSGANNYNSKWIELGKPLDFKSKLSYKDINTKYSYDEAKKSYVPNEKSETTLMELCTTEEGFIPIGTYQGNFDGKGYKITNIYENRNGPAGVFSSITDINSRKVHIKNLSVDGSIISKDGNAGGIAASCGGHFNMIIENCTNNAEIKGINAGGIIGYNRAAAYPNIKKCSNTGKITASEKAGGIVGYAYTLGNVEECINNGEIEGVYAGGIIGWNEAAGITFDKCYNNSQVKGTHAGGIVGGLYIGSLRIWNCGVSSNSEIIGTNNAGGILGNHSNYGTNYIYNSYVLGKISGNNNIGGICGNAYSRVYESGIRVKIENTYFGGNIEGGRNVGGIIGINSCDNLEKLSITNCYYINTISKGISNAEKEGITALSEEDMKVNDALFNSLKSYTNNEHEISAWIKPSNQYPIHNN